MYSITQMQKAEKQRKSINEFLVLSPKLKFNTIKAQILKMISKGLKPKTIAFKHYSVAWTIPQTQVSSMPLNSPADYSFFLTIHWSKRLPRWILWLRLIHWKTRCMHAFESMCILTLSQKPSAQRRILRTQTRAKIVRVRIPTHDHFAVWAAA